PSNAFAGICPAFGCANDSNRCGAKALRLASGAYRAKSDRTEATAAPCVSTALFPRHQRVILTARRLNLRPYQIVRAQVPNRLKPVLELRQAIRRPKYETDTATSPQKPAKPIH